MPSASLTTEGNRVTLEMSLEEAAAVEAILGAVRESEHPELGDATYLTWFALAGIKEFADADWNFDFYTHAEKLISPGDES